MKQKFGRVLALALFCAAVHSAAQDASPVAQLSTPAAPFVIPAAKTIDLGGDWERNPPQEVLSDDDPSAQDKIIFHDQLQRSGFDQICRQAPLRFKQSLSFDTLSAPIGIERTLARYPSGRLAMIDKATVGINFGDGFVADQFDENTSLTIGYSAGIEGQSSIVHPLEHADSCKELKRILNVTNVRFVVPVTKSRLRGMKPGELWRLPMVFRFGASTAFTRLLPHYNSLPVVISLGFSGQDGSSVTMFKIAPNRIRFRLRLDRAVVTVVSVNAAYSIPVHFLGMAATEELLSQFMPPIAAKIFNRYLQGQIGGAISRTDGRQYMVEFNIDPANEQQLEALEKLFQGNLNAFSMLQKLVLGPTALDPAEWIGRQRDDHKVLQDLAKRYAELLGLPKTFTGSDTYHRKGKSFTLHIPMIFTYNNNGNAARDALHLLDDRMGEYHIYRRDHGSDYGILDPPVLNKIFTSQERKIIETFTYKDAKGAQQSPIALYMQQEGFLRASPLTARQMVQRADEVTRLIGVRGSGTNPRSRLPSEILVPKPPPVDGEPQQEGLYRSAVTMLVVAFTQQAIKDILAAPIEDIVHAYINVLQGTQRSLLADLLEHGGSISSNGRINYDESRLEAEDPGQVLSYRTQVRMLADVSVDIVKNLKGIREMNDMQKQAQAFTEFIAKPSGIPLSYDEIIKIVIQLVQPKDVVVEFSIGVNPGSKTLTSVSQNFIINRKNADRALLSNMGRARERFANSSVLKD